jgi:hypothetical protein
LYCQPLPDGATNLWPVASLLLQKPPAEAFVVTTELRVHRMREGERAGLVVFGTDYAWVGVEQARSGRAIVVGASVGAQDGGEERSLATLPAPDGPVLLRVEWRAGAICRLGVSLDGERFTELGPVFSAKPGRWVGAKVGLFATAPSSLGRSPGYGDFAWFRLAPLFSQ